MSDNHTPLEVHITVKWEDIKRLTQELYKTHSKPVRKVGKDVSIGQIVRIQSVRHTFSKASHLRNAYEWLKIQDVNENHVPVTYKNQELDDGDIQGVFYREELTPVDDQGLYSVDVLKTRKKRCRAEHMIR